MSKKLIRPTPEEDAAINHGIATDPDNPEWTDADWAAARPAAQAVPQIVAEYRRTRGPQKTPTKRLVSLRLDRDVIARLQADGPGWQVRLNETLRKAVLGD
jgi:uncharacterized protein (DUF4415 family)